MGEVSNRRRRPGSGEIVPREYERQAARSEFFVSLWGLVPEAHEALCSHNLAETAPLSVLDEEPVRKMIQQWQAKYRLTDPWVRDFVLVDFMPVGLNEGREIPDEYHPYRMRVSRRLGGSCGKQGYSICLVDLGEYYVDENGVESDQESDFVGVFDPRTETVDQAAARILRELDRRLRHELREIVDEDSEAGNNVEARALPPRRHFDWTVRYQALGESYAKIARADDVAASRTVSDAVRAVALLIELTLRERDKGGRPRKQAPVRKARCIALRQNEKTPAPANGQA